MGRKIVITSGKGGVGKTAVTGSLGAMLSTYGYKVALVDGDIGLNNLDIALGIENKVVYDIVDVIDGRCYAKRALINVDNYPNLFVMPSSHNDDEKVVNGQSLKVVVNRLSEIFDFVFIDCPAGIENSFHRSIVTADEAIVVITPSISSVKDANKTIGLINSYRLKTLGLVINMVRGDLITSGDMMDIDEIVQLLKIPPIGVIPFDDEIGINYGDSINYDKNGQVYNAVNMLAQNVFLGKNDLFDCKKRYSGMFGKLRRNIKRRV